MARCDCGLAGDGNLLEINYCCEGLAGRRLCGGSLCLEAGDLSIARMAGHLPGLYFPGGRYRGAAIVLDLDILEKCPPPLLDPERERPRRRRNRALGGLRK